MDKELRSQQSFAIRLSLAVGLLMLAAKWYAFIVTGSSAILSDAAESVIHILAVVFAAFSTWLSHQPADQSHPYGHEKVTYFSAGIEGSLIILAACYIFYESISKLAGTIELQNLDTGTYLILGASLINLFLGLFLIARGKTTHSLILVANGKHVLTDSWTSFGVVAGLFLTMVTGWLAFDPLVAIAVALNIVWSGGKLIRQSVGGLMEEGNPEYERLIRTVLDEETARLGLRYHEVRYREVGTMLWVEFHLLFPHGTLLEVAHQNATDIERAVTTALSIPVRIVSHLESLEAHENDHPPVLRHGDLPGEQKTE